MTEINFEELKDKWPSTVVARDRVEEFTGGLICRGTITNLDSRGEGPPRFYITPRKVGYPVDTFIQWLEERVRTAKQPEAVGGRKRNGQRARESKKPS
jgi:hypothetical protein